eukprot:GAFH01002683.1.p1 GENE.GAFH01002683.1~~GAFH01002683.1.p1  ORF type:complete len:286 (+),score=144.09 GAFH01002683.1:23-859(+)
MLALPSLAGLGQLQAFMEQYVAIQEHCARAMQTFARGYEAPTEPQNVFMNLWPRPKRIAQQMEAQYTRLAQQIREVIEGTKAKVEAVRKTKKSLQRLAQKHSADHGTSAAELRKCANKANKCLGELVRTLEGYREKGPGQIQKNASRLQKLYDVASKAQQAYRDERAGHDQRLEGLTRAMGDVAEALQGAEEDCIAFGRDVSRQVIEQQANCLTGHLDETLAFLQAIETISPQRATAAFVQANRHNQPNPEFALAAPDELPPMSQLLNESAPRCGCPS